MTEWRPPDYATLQPVEVWIVAFAALAVVGRLRLRPERWLLVAGLAWMALTRSRHAEWLAFIAPLIAADGAGVKIHNSTRRAWPFPGRASITAALVAIGATTTVTWRSAGAPQSKIAPARAVDRALAARLDGAVFNDYDFGGYLIFRRVPVFVDGRIDLYGDTFMRDYGRALDGDRAALATLLARHHVTWAILRPTTAASSALGELPEWRTIYADDTAHVYSLAPSGSQSPPTDQ